MMHGPDQGPETSSLPLLEAAPVERPIPKQAREARVRSPPSAAHPLSGERVVAAAPYLRDAADVPGS